MSTKEPNAVESKEYFDQFQQLDRYRPSATIFDSDVKYVGIILQTCFQSTIDLRSVRLLALLGIFCI